MTGRDVKWHRTFRPIAAVSLLGLAVWIGIVAIIAEVLGS